MVENNGYRECDKSGIVNGLKLKKKRSLVNGNDDRT